MKPFRYKLRALEMLRERHEHDALERYALALAQRAQALHHVEAAERDLCAARFELQARVTTGCAAHELNRLQLHCESMQKRRARSVIEMQSAERSVNQRLAEMLAARREREAVEKHHQKSLDEHRRAGQREEQRWLDDLTPQRGLLPEGAH